MSVRMVHFGALSSDSTTQVADLPPLDQTHAGRGGSLTAQGFEFETDLDSFTVWGEFLPTDEDDDDPQGLYGDPVHFTLGYVEPEGISVDYRGQFVAHVREVLLSALPVGWRLADYVVITDAEDWSEDVEIVGRYA